MLRSLIVLAVFVLPQLHASPTLTSVGNRNTGWRNGDASVAHDEFLDKVQPIFTQRCVACHGCYEAPCQLNLQSYDGLLRGFNPIPIYGSKRLGYTAPTRLNEAATVQGWRRLGFLPVAESGESSIMYKFLEASHENVPGFGVANVKVLRDSLEDATSCVASQRDLQVKFSRENPYGVLSFEDFVAKNSKQAGANVGMPLGLPKLDDSSEAALMDWIKEGAPGPSDSAKDVLGKIANPKPISEWENFLNDDSLQAQVSARYIYEHIFTALVQFSEDPGEYFDLVRSRTREGAIDPILTELPYDNPGVPRVYYRFSKVTRALVQKTQNVWRLSPEKLAHLKDQFMGDWQVPVRIPEYSSNNPFKVFEQIPGSVRAKFMMENARLIIGAMVQGTVCVGSGATYAISDHFWVWFLRPDMDPSAINPDLGLPSIEILNTALIPGETTLQHYNRTVKQNRIYQKAFERNLRLVLKAHGKNGLRLTDIWKGDGDPLYPSDNNPNAWLNVTRHGKSATVQYGSEGGMPQTVWVLSYSNFERLYYNLVANFKSWGDMVHRLSTWRIMSYVRLEAEDLSISFLPISQRKEVREWFTRDIGPFKNYQIFPIYSLQPMDTDDKSVHWPWHQPDLPARDGDPTFAGPTAKLSVRHALQTMGDALKAVDREGVLGVKDISAERQSWEKSLKDLEERSELDSGVKYPGFLPETSYVRIEGESGEYWVYTILADRAYKDHDLVFLEKFNREAARDTLSTYRGFVGAYPNIFFDVKKESRDRFVSELGRLSNEGDWDRFVARYAIAPNSAKFWPLYDWFHEFKSLPSPGVDPVEQGMADLSQYLVFSE